MLEIVDRLDIAPSLSDGRSLGSFYFLRHGRTANNLKGVAQGQQDIPLDEVGRAQAERVRPALVDQPILRVVASPLSRAWETAELATRGLGRELTPERGLMERSFGDYEGSPPPKGLWTTALPTVEPMEEFGRRVGGALRQHCAGEGTLVVAHGGVLRAVAALLDLTLEPFHLENCLPLRFVKGPAGWTIVPISVRAAAGEIS